MKLFGLALFLLVAAVGGQEAEIESSVGINERAPTFVKVVTFIVTSTISAVTTTTITTATTCTSTALGAQACSGKRRRRGILLSDEEYLGAEIIKPTAVNAVEATQAPVVEFDAKRQAREAQFFDYNHYFPLWPTFNPVPYSPKLNQNYGFAQPRFKGYIDSDDSPSSLQQSIGPDGRLFLVAFSTTSSFTSTSTSTSYTATTSLVVQCTAASSFSACGSG